MRILFPCTKISFLSLIALWALGNSLVKAQVNLNTFAHDGQLLQAYPTDLGTLLPWGLPNDATGATHVINGSANTQTIVSKYGNLYQGNYAAKACADLHAFGYNDWYLPSRAELLSLYRSRNETGGFSNTLYWSSTDDTWGSTSTAVDFDGGIALSRSKDEMNRVRCVRKTGEFARHKAIHASAVKHGDYIPVARYRINDKGTAGLVFASKMLGFFTAAAFNETFLAMAGEVLMSEIKTLGITYIISAFDQSDPSKELPSYITICFPILNLGSPLELKDILFLEEFPSSRLVPLGFPGTLYYNIKEKSDEGPILASTVSRFNKSVFSIDRYDFLTVFEASRGNHTTISPNKTFQTVGVVAKYKKHLGEVMMIMKQYEHYSHGFASGTDMSYIAVKIPAGTSRLPIPGSVVHVFGETKNLNEIGQEWRLQVNHTPWERKATAKFVEMHSMALVSGDYYNYNQDVYDKSIFSLHFDAAVYQGVIIDFSSVPQVTKQQEFSGAFLFELDLNEKQVLSKIIGGHFIELDIDPVESFEFNLYFDGIYYRLRNVSYGMASNSTFLWESGFKQFLGETSLTINSTPIILTIQILRKTDRKVLVEAHVQNNPSYKFEYNIKDYLGEYYCPGLGLGVCYSFYFDGGQLHVKGPMESPYFQSGPLIKTGYRSYKREWTSAHGISSTHFTFNTAMHGFITVNAISDLVDWPSQGMLLFKK